MLQPHCISNEVMAQAFFSFCHDESRSFRLWVIRCRPGTGPSWGWLHYCQYQWAKARVPHAKHLRSVCRGFRYLFICDMSLLLACIVLVSSGCTFTRLSFSVPSSSALLPTCLLCCTLFFQLPHFFFLLWKHEGRNSHQPECSTEPQKPCMCSSEWKLCSWRRIRLCLGTEPKTFPKQPLC